MDQNWMHEEIKNRIFWLLVCCL